MAMRSRGQRVSRRKSGHHQRRTSSGISSSEIGWEEKFNLRSSLSKERVGAADFEGDERECTGDNWVEHNDMDEEDEEEADSYKEEEEGDKGNYREEGEFEWRSENSLGDCEARLSDMVALMQKAGARIQYGESPLEIDKSQ